MPIRASIVNLYPTTTSGDTTKPGTPVVTLLSQAGLFATFHTAATPGDNGFGGGNAYAFRTAFASAPIDTEAKWLAASFFESANNSNVTAPNDPQDFVVEFMASGTWYFAVRFLDAAGNVGGISNSVAVTV